MSKQNTLRRMVWGLLEILDKCSSTGKVSKSDGIEVGNGLLLGERSDVMENGDALIGRRNCEEDIPPMRAMLDFLARQVGSGALVRGLESRNGGARGASS